jgi:uncharacterized repeat protein (TIGR01451 family)
MSFSAPFANRRLRAGWLALALGLWSMLLVTAHAVPPPAGTSIGNQASATYVDGSNTARTVTSNTVQTTVAQVGSLTLTASGAKTASLGSTVYYPHTLTNTGNGADTFSLAAVSTSGTFTATGITIYADNGSGQPTGAAITTTGSIASNATFKFIVAASVPATATAAQTNLITVTGTSAFTPAATTTNTDTTTVTANAVINLTKAVSASSGAAGAATQYTYTLTYTNTGNSTATAVKLTDAIPTGLTYVAGSGIWSVGATALTDTKTQQGTTPNQITYDYAVTTAGTVTATITNVAPGQSGTVSFKVTVAAATAAGTLVNTAALSYNDGSGTTVTGASNGVPFTVTQASSVTITNGTTIASATPGATLAFTNTVTNTGNGTDTFNIAVSGSTYPAGTTFVLYKSDGVTPLIDTNNDGIPDTGPIVGPTGTYAVTVKAVLPANAAGTGPFTVNITATSTKLASATATGTDVLTALTASSVDVTNNNTVAGGGLGIGAGAGAIIVTNTTNPATSTTFIVIANNTGANADTYDLAASTSATLASIALPAGWTVTFKADGGAGTCTTTGATITNTGTVIGGGNAKFCAVVSVPAGYAASTTNLYFRALSPATAAQDIIGDAVIVSSVRSLTFTPNNTGQTYIAGSMTYSHTLTNTGNVLEGNAAVSTITLPSTNSQTGWTSVQYYDANNNGVLDATDPVIPAAGLAGVVPAGLAPGASITIFDKVTAPSGGAPGVVNVTTVTVTTTNGSYTSTAPAAAPATDSTTVIAGNVTLVKTQGLDAACTGTPPGGYSTVTITTGAVPGACIDYSITVTNVGSASATSVVVSDATPAFTVLSATAPATTAGTITANPGSGVAGTVTATVGTLTAGASSVLTFGVKIQQ